MSTYASATDHHVVIHAVSPPKNVSPGYFQVALAVVATILIAPALIVTIPIDALSFYLFKTMPFLNLWNAFRVWQIRHHPDSTLLSAVTDSLGFYDFLDLVVLSGGERSVIFAKRMKNDGGFCFVMFRGFWLSKHADVAKLLTGPQNRSNLIGTWQMEVPLVMSPISPILLSNPSDAHSAVRGLLTGGTVGSEDAQSRLKNASSVLAPIVKEWLTYKKPLDGDFLAKIVFRCIMKLLFDSEPTEDILKSVSKYRLLTTGVLVPRFAHAFTGYAIAKGLKKHRTIVSHSLPLRADTQFVSKAADVGIISDDACDTVTDLLLFAGVIGTSHLVNDVCKRLDENKAERVPLYRENPSNFIYECSRLNPPVTSFTTLCSRPTVVEYHGREMEIPAGTPVAGCLSNANIDPACWGEDAKEFNTHRDYSKLVTWNGLLSTGPRICPGFDLSKTIALELSSAYAGCVTYEITIFTGASGDASSDSDAVLKIFGTKGNTAELQWPKNDKHKRGEIECFSFPRQIDVGEVLSVSFWRKEEDLIDFSPNWFVDKLEVTKIGDGPSKTFKFPFYSWVPTTPITVFEGRASTVTQVEESTTRFQIRAKYLKEKQKEYSFVTHHKDLGEWGSTLPTATQLDARGDIPLAEKPLKEEKDDFSISVKDAIANAGFSYVSHVAAKTLDEYVANTAIPNLIQEKQDVRLPDRPGWRTDVSFGNMMIAGMNPVQLKVATEIPPDFAVTDAMLPQGRTLATELQNKRLFTLDDDFLVSMAGKHIVGDETRYLAVPFSLFHADAAAGLKLLPIAIQIDRKRGCPVFTPKDDPWDWFAARLFLLNCHFQIHQFRAHALWCHLMQEPVSISLNRMLPPCHPIYKLLRPHFRGLASINAKARGSLVASADRQSLYSKQGDVMTVGATGNIKVAQLAYAKNTYEGIFFRNRLRETGILDDIAIGDHPYRDDGLLLLESIEKYVCKIVDIYYPTDASVAADIELQAWARDVVTEGKVVGFPGNGAITSKDMLSYICSNIIFIGAAFHGAVNFAQIVFAGNVANMPGSLLAPPPTEKGKLTEKDILAMLPSHGAALIQIGLLMILSTNSTERLGHIPQELFVDEAALKAQKEWREDLENVEKTIQMRNLGRAETYNGFLPSVTPNSTAI